jgi:hypothetical protein
MSFSQVLTQYDRALANQLKRRDRQKRDFFTKNENAAVRYYNGAFLAVQRLEPAREGEKIFAEDLHAENPDMRGPQLEKLPTDSGDPVGGAQA